MKIGVDIDGVVIDFVGSFSRVLREQYGIKLNYEDIFCHDLGPVLGITKEEVRAIVHRTMETNNFDLIPGSREALLRLTGAGHEIVLITSRPRRYLAKTKKILAKHGIPYKKLVFTQFLAKHLGEKDLGAVIEDSLEEAIALVRHKVRVFLMRHPWNRGTLNVRRSFTTAANWEEVLAQLEAMGLSLGPPDSGHSSVRGGHMGRASKRPIGREEQRQRRERSD